MLKRFIQSWKTLRAPWRGLRAFNRLPISGKQIVFYAETAADWAYLGPVAEALEKRRLTIVRICSDPADPALQQPLSFYVGFGGARTVLFRTIEAQAFVMTLCDLESFHLKRSVHPVHYFYIFHSIASLHRVYRLHAFDAYDTILCVGPHHEREVRQTESVYGLKPKRLVPHGYGRLDTLLKDMAGRSPEVPAEGPLRVLVAPTWGESSLVDHGLEPLLRVLLDSGFEVTLRLHPMTHRHHPGLARELARRLTDKGRLILDPQINTTQSLLNADIMVSEWSGAPLDYAFSRLRPVIFMDTPPKIHNPEYDRLGLPCLEEDIREKIGRVVPPDQFQKVPDVIRELTADAANWTERIRLVRDKSVYHVCESGEAGARAILETLNLEPQAPEE